MGDVIHEYAKPHLDWWEVDEEPPIIESDVVIAWGAKVIGHIRISSYSYITSGAIVTKSVPPKHIVKGINEQIPLKDWKGNRLKDLIRYWTYEK
jgi:serine acetyltransferase